MFDHRCVFSTRKIFSIDFLLFQADTASHQVVEEGIIVADDQSSLKIDIDGTEAYVITRIPETFFEGMNEITDGKALGIAVIQSVSAGASGLPGAVRAMGKSEVG